MRKNSIKNIRINEEVMRELSNIIRGEIKDPRINPMTSVVAVEVAPDLKTAKAYISVLGDEQSQKDTLAGLRSAKGFIRVKLAKSINLRNTPEIKFVLDQSIEYGIRMSKMIDDVTKNQKEFINALASNQIIFASGPAGTGKTFLAVAYALEEVFSGRKNKIVMTRPVVEAGESLGFLPGDLSQKLNPYLRPLYDAMDLLLNPQQIKRLEENGTIEIAPLAYMRGRSLNNSVVILDEAQNTTSGQMRMFLTRIGESSTAIITGDPTQIDLPKKSDSGFTEAIKILCGIESLSVVKFSHRDTVRSRIVREIVKAYSLEESDGI